MQSICVFCGSSFGNRPEYRDSAAALGEILARQGIRLVYGGGRVGLMGAVARSVLENGGLVTGVIPEALKKKEVALEECTELHVVPSMHDRKALMAELSDGFIAMPGGLGTLEEVFEALTWLQLGIHDKPCGLLNVNGYYSSLLDFLRRAADDNFILPDHVEMLQVSDDPRELIEMLTAFTAPDIDKAEWIRENSL